MQDTMSIANQLWQARLNGDVLDDLPSPASIEAAYELQALINQVSGQEIIGYKIGATSKEIQQLLNVDSPFYGPLYKDYSNPIDAAVPVHTKHTPRVEAEFVVVLKEALTADNSASISRQQVEQAIDHVAVAFEIIGTRIQQDSIDESKRGRYAIADFGSNLDFVSGCARNDWQNIDLSKSPVSLAINDEQIASGHSGLSVAGHPFEIVVWLANQPGIKKTGLPAGTQISCGTCTPVFAVKPGDKLQADFHDFGELTCTITD